MRSRLLLVTALMLVAGLAFTAPAHASTVTECRELVTDLAASTGSAAFNNVKDRDGLVAKAGAAALKLDEDKIADARQKLVDYDATLDGLFLARKPKIAEGAYLILDEKVAAALSCIDHLS